MKEDYWDFNEDKVHQIKHCMENEIHSSLRQRFSNRCRMPEEMIILNGLFYEPARRCTAKEMAKIFRDAYYPNNFGMYQESIFMKYFSLCKNINI